MAEKTITPVSEDIKTADTLPGKEKNGMDIPKVLEAAEKVAKTLEEGTQPKESGKPPTPES